MARSNARDLQQNGFEINGGKGEHLPPEVRWLLVGAIAVNLVSVAILTQQFS
jgi:hypothetical protein